MEQTDTPIKNTGAQRQRRYRERQREGVPSDATFANELCHIVFENLTNDRFRQVDAVSQVRSRLLKRGYTLYGSQPRHPSQGRRAMIRIDMDPSLEGKMDRIGKAVNKALTLTLPDSATFANQDLLAALKAKVDRPASFTLNRSGYGITIASIDDPKPFSEPS
jgi:hypothetical protein